MLARANGRLAKFRRVLASFPGDTALGWDSLHPRAILRLGDHALVALLRILLVAEFLGEWPAAVAMIVIVLLPKPDGGRRPIGLLPFLPRVWMRARREIVFSWELEHDRPYLYAGPAKGAQVATWRQAARAELAAATGVEYAQTLLDLVKAFERVPHDVLVREALRLNFPLRILRLSLAAYRLARVLKVGEAFSSLIWAVRGITAGSALATSEMRLFLINVLDRAVALYPMTKVTAYVDDVSSEVAATRRLILRDLPDATAYICTRLRQNGAEVSTTKSFCTASTDSLGREIAARLAGYGFTFKRHVKSLGAGLAAGVRRNMGVARGRLHAFRRRLGLFRRLRKARVDTARLLRTGGTAALTYDPATMGVPPSHLNRQRRVAAEAAAPAGGTAGQSVDLFFALEEAVCGTTSDPAVPAHRGPIGQWAFASWESWLPRGALLRLTAHAKRRLSRARSAWAVVTGPAASFVASATRLGWLVRDAFSVTTDCGEDLRFDLDPPVIVQRAVARSVQRWRWRRVELAFPHLHHPTGHVGADLEPIAKLLRSRSNDGVWNRETRAGLRSALVGRQWPQARLFSAALSVHNRCCFCLHRLLISLGLSADQAAFVNGLLARVTNSRRLYHRDAFDSQEAVTLLVDRFGDDLVRQLIDPHVVECALRQAPVGTSQHRIWQCPTLEPQRTLHAPAQFLALVRSVSPPSPATATRALFPSPFHIVPPPPPLETFEWVVPPADGSGCFQGAVYPDGSAYDNCCHSLRRLGWSFVAVDTEGRVVAAARGRPPSWVRDVPGAEAWALLQALSRALPGSTFYTDCLQVARAMWRGRKWATAAQRPLARTFNLLFSASDDRAPGDFVWLPSHKGTASVGVIKLSNGATMTEIDRVTNQLADDHAKHVARRERVHDSVREELERLQTVVADVARWIGIATASANAQPGPVVRDSTGTLGRLYGRRGKRGASTGSRRPPLPPRLVEPRPPSLGGHVIVRDARVARCIVCRRRSRRWDLFARGRCSGSAAARWADRAVADAEHDVADGGGHRRLLAGDVIWCGRCGCYAAGVARGLARPCPGPPAPGGNSGGRCWQLRQLRKGRHPVSGRPLPRSVPEDQWDEGTCHDLHVTPPSHGLCELAQHQQRSQQQPPRQQQHQQPVPATAPPGGRLGRPRGDPATEEVSDASRRLAALRRRVLARTGVAAHAPGASAGPGIEAMPAPKRQRIERSGEDASGNEDTHEGASGAAPCGHAVHAHVRTVHLADAEAESGDDALPPPKRPCPGVFSYGSSSAHGFSECSSAATPPGVEVVAVPDGSPQPSARLRCDDGQPAVKSSRHALADSGPGGSSAVVSTQSGIVVAPTGGAAARRLLRDASHRQRAVRRRLADEPAGQAGDGIDPSASSSSLV